MPVNREHFNRIDDNTPSDQGDTLGKKYEAGMLTSQEVQDILKRSPLNFWDLFDFSDYLSSEDTVITSWLNEALIETAYDTYTCTMLIHGFSFDEIRTS